MSHRRTIEVVLCVAIALVVGLAAPRSRSQVQAGRSDHFSVVPMEPDAKAALKAQGRQLKFPFPNSVNQGRKFNPKVSTTQVDFRRLARTAANSPNVTNPLF